MGNGLPDFPKTLPAQTVVGNPASTPQVASAIPFASLAAALGIPFSGASSQFVGGGLTPSVGSNALTVALKTTTGADPSSASPVYLTIRDATVGSGVVTTFAVTSAFSLTISSGSTLGTSNGVAFRLWCVAFNDGGTLRLGLINCLSGTNIYPLGQVPIASSTAEGGAGAADSAQVFYTGSAVTSKPYVVLGFLEWQTGLATAGTWSALPTVVQLFGQGIPLPGAVMQTINSETGAVATGTTNLPFDDTIPQSNEGDQYMSQAITPRAAANVLRVQSQIGVSASAVAATLTMALFQDIAADALAAVAYTIQNGGYASPMTIFHELIAATISATTFKVRAGQNQSTTYTFNGQGGARKFGGVLNSYLRVQEIQA